MNTKGQRHKQTHTEHVWTTCVSRGLSLSIPVSH